MPCSGSQKTAPSPAFQAPSPVGRGKKVAFTLAEVLITLGIIGVVAAMTMPALITKYKKQQTVTHLKKVYTTLNQAMRLSEAEYGPYEYWDLPDSNDVHSYYEKYWYPHFKILKSCESFDICGYKSFFPYKTIDGQPNSHSFSVPRFRVPFVITDGTVISISVKGGEAENLDNTIYVDLNGSSEPNMYGKDLFRFTRVKGKGVLPECYGSQPEEIDEDCKTTGVCCAAKIIKDGWEIRDDYPW